MGKGFFYGSVLVIKQDCIGSERPCHLMWNSGELVGPFIACLPMQNGTCALGLGFISPRVVEQNEGTSAFSISLGTGPADGKPGCCESVDVESLIACVCLVASTCCGFFYTWLLTEQT